MQASPQHPSLVVCIMAGGSGERFWPLSRTHTPKHLLKLLTDRTLLEETVHRVSGLVPPDRLFVLTNETQLSPCRACLGSLPPDHIVAEPAKRDTAPATALATALARRHGDDTVVCVLPADAMIKDVAAFQRNLADAAHAAAQLRALVVFGIPPTYPATGFGYVEMGEPIAALPQGSQAVRVLRFVEKPDSATAERYLAEQRFTWNAGIFLWRVDVYLEEIRRHAPELATFIDDFPSGDFLPYLAERFPHLPKISVDYALAEKASNVIAINAAFDWDDVGTWTSLPAHLGADAHANTVRGPAALLDARNNIVLSESRTVALCGVDNLVVVETADAVLVCHRDAVQNVKGLQPQLPESLR